MTRRDGVQVSTSLVMRALRDENILQSAWHDPSFSGLVQVQVEVDSVFGRGLAAKA